jgi:hypothetical protein
MSIETSPTTAALMKAMHSFQGAVDGVKRDSTNPHFRNRYASLENVMDTARPHLQAFGLVLMQAPGRVVDGCIEVSTRISHAESGEWLQATMHVPLAKRDPQAAGSALTYGQRYSAMAALGLPPTDDDAEDAFDRRNERPTPANVTDADRKASAAADSLIASLKMVRTAPLLSAWREEERPHIRALTRLEQQRVIDAFNARERELTETMLEAG